MYEILDPILKLYVEQDKSSPEITAAGYDEDVVRRVVSMVDRSEYKRRQAPPGVKITPRALGRDRHIPYLRVCIVRDLARPNRLQATF